MRCRILLWPCGRSIHPCTSRSSNRTSLRQKPPPPTILRSDGLCSRFAGSDAARPGRHTELCDSFPHCTRKCKSLWKKGAVASLPARRRQVPAMQHAEPMRRERATPPVLTWIRVHLCAGRPPHRPGWIRTSTTAWSRVPCGGRAKISYRCAGDRPGDESHGVGGTAGVGDVASQADCGLGGGSPFSSRQRTAGKSPMAATSAAMGKLLTILNAMGHHGTRWQSIAEAAA